MQRMNGEPGLTGSRFRPKHDRTMMLLLALLAALDGGVPPVPVAGSPHLRDAKLILADYAHAIGDEKAWRKHKSVRVKREVSVKSMNFKSVEETRLTRGGKLFSVSSAPGLGTSRRGYDGHTAWGDDPIFGLRVLTGAEAEEVRIAATWNPEWHLDEIYAGVRAIPPPEGAPAGGVECVELDKREGAPTITCFDRRTHLRVWEKGVQASQGGDIPYVTRFSDWRRVDGVRVWYHEDVTVGPVTMACQIVNVAFDERVPARLFRIPKAKSTAK
jgi:hypothetical protein